MTTTPSTGQPANVSDNDDPQPATGLIAGTVLQAARQSAGLTPSELAAALSLSDTDVNSWEDGTDPLALVPVPQMDRLKSALRDAGAEAQLIADLDPAAWCDLVLEAITAGEDPSCLLADPLAREPAFTELLTWAITGHPPARYAQCTRTIQPMFAPAGAAVLRDPLHPAEQPTQ